MYLTCSCGNKDFVDIHKLRTSQAGSVVKEVAGSRCTACGKNADFGRLLREADIRQRRQDLVEATRELEAASGAPVKVEEAKPAITR
jgi:hypothetical protein